MNYFTSKRFSVISPIVLLHENLLALTKSFTESVRKGMIDEDELIFVDNGSQIGSDWAKKEGDLYVSYHYPVGYGEAMNAGIRLSKGKYVVFANNDMTVGPDWAQKMEKVLESDPTIGIVSCNGQNMVPSTGIAFNGIFWAAKRELIEEVGFFPHLAPRQGDDSDFCLRAVAAGWNITYADFFFSHPERKQTHNQSTYNASIRNSPQLKFQTFQEKWGFREQDWYREGLKRRNS